MDARTDQPSPTGRTCEGGAPKSCLRGPSSRAKSSNGCLQIGCPHDFSFKFINLFGSRRHLEYDELVRSRSQVDHALAS